MNRGHAKWVLGSVGAAVLGAFLVLGIARSRVARVGGPPVHNAAQRDVSVPPRDGLNDSGTEHETQSEESRTDGKGGARHYDWQEEPLYNPTPEEVVANLHRQVDLLDPGPVTARLVRAYPEVVLAHMGPIVFDSSRPQRERYQALNAILLLAEVQNAQAKDVLIALLRDPDLNGIFNPFFQLFRCYGHLPDVRAVLSQRQDFAALFGDARAAYDMQTSRLTNADQSALVAAVSTGDFARAGGVLLQAQANSASQEVLLAATFAVHRKEMLPYLRKYIEVEKTKGQYGTHWEGVRNIDAFLEHKRLYEAVRVLHALGGELTERETEFLTYIGIIGDPKQAIFRRFFHPDE